MTIKIINFFMLNDENLGPNAFSVYACNGSNCFRKILVVSEQMVMSWCSYLTHELER